MPEIFNRRMDDIITECECIVKSMDDFLVFGNNVKKHDERLRTFLQVLSEYGITLNPEKCVSRQQEVEFLEYSVSSQGVKAVDEKVEAIR